MRLWQRKGQHNRFKHRQDICLPFMLHPGNTKEYLSDANQIDQTKQPLTNDILRRIANAVYTDLLSSQIYNWVYYHQTRTQVVSLTEHLHHGFAVLGFYLLYNEAKQQLRVTCPDPSCLDTPFYTCGIRDSIKPERIKDFLDKVNTMSEFIPLFLQEKEAEVYINDKTSTSIIHTPGSAILKNSFIRKRLSAYRFIVKPGCQYIIYTDDNSETLKIKESE